jgi:hypothetical protein
MGTVTVGIVLYVQSQMDRPAQEAAADLQAAIAEVDRAEPDGWQMEDIERRREKIPDAENGGKVVLAAAKLLPQNWNDDPVLDQLNNLPPAARLRDEQAQALRKHLDKLQPALREARKLVDYPKGRYAPAQISRDYFNTPLPHAQAARDVAALLMFDAVRQCEEREYRNAWASAVAALHAGRSLGDDPFVVSHAVRFAARHFAVAAMERILGHGEMDMKSLALAGDLLKREGHLNLVGLWIPAERAGQHHFYTRLAKGEISTAELAKLPRALLAATAPEQPTAADIAVSHAYVLRILSRAVECGRRAEGERGPCFAKWNGELQEAIGKKRIPPLADGFIPRIWQFRNSEGTSDTLLECTRTALAAERFRLQAKRWPKDLEELVTAKLLEKMPADYYKNQPLQVRNAKDGLVVYSLLTGHAYEGTAWDDLQAPPEIGLQRVEFRLWNPEHRRQPAPPPPPP